MQTADRLRSPKDVLWEDCMRRRHKIMLGMCLLAAVGLTAAGIALAMPRPTPAPSCPSPEILIKKKQASLELICGGVLTRSFPATFGARPSGPKEREGDERTPEGQYTITARLVTPKFHRFLGISYPNDQDLARAASLGITRPGRGIGIHGVNVGRAGLARVWTRVAAATGLARVWGPTDGCIGLTNEDVQVVFDAAPVGTKVVITP